MRDYLDEILNYLEPEDLHGDMEFVNEMAGMDIVKFLIKNSAGIRLYVPKISAFNQAIVRFFEKNKGLAYDAKELRTIAKKTGLSERYITNIARKKAPPCHNQVNLFDSDAS